MLGIAFVVWSVLIWPLIIRSFVSIDVHHLPSGFVTLTTIGFSARVDWQMIRTEQGVDIELRYGNMHLGDGKRMKEINKRRRMRLIGAIRQIPSIKENLKSYLHDFHLSADVLIGTGDAANTALVCAALTSLLGCIRHVRGKVTPDFRNTVLCADVKCIAAFRLGKLLLSSALILLAIALQSMRKNFGGAQYGPTASDQQCDADSA